MKREDYQALPIGSEVRTYWGNRFRKFGHDEWSPLDGGHWDRWTTLTDAEMAKYYNTEVVK